MTIGLPVLPSGDEQLLPLAIGLRSAGAVLVEIAIALGVFFGSDSPAFISI